MSNPTADPRNGWCCDRPSVKSLTTDAGVILGCERCNGHWYLTLAQLKDRDDYYKPFGAVTYG